MAIIYTYPVKVTPAANDLILISDSADSNKTKQIKISSLPSSGAGISLTTVGTSGPAELNGTVLNIPNYATGGTPSLPLNGVQYRDDNGNFAASSNLKYNSADKTLTVGEQDQNSGTLFAAGGQNGTGTPKPGALKLGDDGTSGGIITLRAPSDVPNSYSIILPDAIPGGNDKILQSDANGNLSWIDTPSGGGSVPLAANGTRGGIQIGYAQNAKNYPVVLASEKAYVTVPWTDNNTTDITLTTTGTSGAATWNGTTLNIPQYSGGGNSGFETMSIYEATGFFESGETGHKSVMRQSVNEAGGEISSVDFFRLQGTDRISVSVYSGNIASQVGQLVLFGRQNTGTANSINTITFESPYTFTPGEDIVIVVSLYNIGGNNAQVAGSSSLLSNAKLSLESSTYIDPEVEDLATLMGTGFENNPSDKGACLHFYN
jgi:hypothetical protein